MELDTLSGPGGQVRHATQAIDPTAAVRLVSQCRAGRADHPGHALVRLLFERYGRALLAYATGLTGNRWAAEEIVQEAMLRAWRHADELSAGSGTVRPWLVTVVRNLAIDRARAGAARPVEVAETPYQPPLQDDHADSVAVALDLTDALRSLSDKHRQILVELYYHDRTASETAQRLGIPVGTVKSRAYHALRSLREHLDRMAPAREPAMAGLPAAS
jgi:RNA polymerase sigma-70 factor, ECF subfamily